jgi:hypothetical protein
VEARDQARRPRPARRSVCAGLAVLILCAVPAPAVAQTPFDPLPTQPTPTPTVTAPTTSSPSTSGGGLSSTEQIALFAAGVLLIGGIAFLIRRDAHAQAPVKRPAGTGPRATTQPRAKRVEQSRARAKAARRQRKRTR